MPISKMILCGLSIVATGGTALVTKSFFPEEKKPEASQVSSTAGGENNQASSDQQEKNSCPKPNTEGCTEEQKGKDCPTTGAQKTCTNSEQKGPQ